MDLVVPLPWVKPPIAQNDRRHWTAQYRDFQAAKTQAWWAIRAARLPQLERVEVTLHWRVPDLRRRDCDGPAPTLKVCLDALVDEHVIPDDSWQHVPRVSIQIHPPEPGQTVGLWLSLEDIA